MKQIILVLMLLLATATYSWSQGCVMCAQTAASLGETGSKGLNFGILYLAAIPVTFLGTLFFLWMKKSKNK